MWFGHQSQTEKGEQECVPVRTQVGVWADPRAWPGRWPPGCANSQGRVRGATSVPLQLVFGPQC